jgi:hypothetical protein
MSKYTINFDIIQPIDIDSLGQELGNIEAAYYPFHIKNLQYYHPIYKLFQENLKEGLEKEISLNHPYKFLNSSTIYSLGSPIQKKEKDVFIKFAPLVDPLKFLIGKYKDSYDRIRTLPSPKDPSLNSHEKLTSIHNASYIDNFFCYLSGQALYHHDILHGLEYYGSFLGIQEKYRMNIADDLDYVMQSDYFLENKGILYEMDDISDDEDSKDLFSESSRANRGKINIHNHTNISIVSLSGDLEIESVIKDDMELIPIDDFDTFDKENGDIHLEVPEEDDSDNSEVNYSDSEDEEEEDDEDGDEDEEDEDEEDDEDEEEEDEEDESSGSFAPDPVVNAYFYNFPVQMICLEKCHGTLDELFSKKILDLDTAASALFQVIMTLMIYQKMYHFTHNDLHTQNIMYIETDIEFLYYSYKKQVYKVPTYGRLFKIIDFGRAIYKFQGHLFCSDSFELGGDGHTQYNCEPFFDESKPRIEPNYSFDLCRLGCSIYDYILDIEQELDVKTEKNDLEKTIIEWVSDDNKKNVLYKKSGEERYPNFKLYKMIARTVHKVLPEDQLKNPFFSQFKYKVPKKEQKGLKIIDIDQLPTYI